MLAWVLLATSELLFLEACAVLVGALDLRLDQRREHPPRAEEFAVMPLPAVSSAVTFVRPTITCLLATYAALCLLATRPCAEAMLMICPQPRARMLVSACFAT